MAYKHGTAHKAAYVRPKHSRIAQPKGPAIREPGQWPTIRESLQLAIPGLEGRVGRGRRPLWGIIPDVLKFTSFITAHSAMIYILHAYTSFFGTQRVALSVVTVPSLQ